MLERMFRMLEQEIGERLQKISEAFKEGRICKVTYELLLKRHDEWCKWERASKNYKDLA
jgi:hypothetical protein